MTHNVYCLRGKFSLKFVDSKLTKDTDYQVRVNISRKQSFGKMLMLSSKQELQKVRSNVGKAVGKGEKLFCLLGDKVLGS